MQGRDRLVSLAAFLRGLIASGMIPADRLEAAQLVVDLAEAMLDRDHLAMCAYAASRATEYVAVDPARARATWQSFEGSGSAEIAFRDSWRRHGEIFIETLLILLPPKP
jgi:hypothetical protein